MRCHHDEGVGFPGFVLLGTRRLLDAAWRPVLLSPFLFPSPPFNRLLSVVPLAPRWLLRTRRTFPTPLRVSEPRLHLSVFTFCFFGKLLSDISRHLLSCGKLAARLNVNN